MIFLIGGFGFIGCNILKELESQNLLEKVIVIDEVVGQLIAMLTVLDNFLLLFLSFLIFRFFDIVKPWPASFFDKNMKNGKGVMMDDVIAGIYSLIILIIIEMCI